MKAGDIITFMHDSFYHSGKVLHKTGDKATVLGVNTEPGRYSNLCPDIWIPEHVTSILIVGFQGTYFQTSFYEYFIGEKVAKQNVKKGVKIFNRKKFKSARLINTIKGVIDHPELGIPAYTFEEDDSYVECRRCKVLNKEELVELLK
jgi:hypothetical protein